MLVALTGDGTASVRARESAPGAVASRVSGRGRMGVGSVTLLREPWVTQGRPWAAMSVFLVGLPPLAEGAVSGALSGSLRVSLR